MKGGIIMTYTVINEKMQQALHEDDFESFKRLSHIMQYCMMIENGMDSLVINIYMEQNSLTEKDVAPYVDGY